MLEVSKFDMKRFLSSERQMLSWRTEGLPSDQVSVENAMCILNSRQSAFIVDPSNRAADWIRNAYKDSLEVTNQQDGRFQLNLELAVRLGKTLLVTDVHSVEPVLFPLLRGDLAGQGVYKSILIGDKSVDFNPEFRLLMSTRNTEPNLPPGQY